MQTFIFRLVIIPAAILISALSAHAELEPLMFSGQSELIIDVDQNGVVDANDATVTAMYDPDTDYIVILGDGNFGGSVLIFELFLNFGDPAQPILEERAQFPPEGTPQFVNSRPEDEFRIFFLDQLVLVDVLIARAQSVVKSLFGNSAANALGSLLGSGNTNATRTGEEDFDSFIIQDLQDNNSDGVIDAVQLGPLPIFNSTNDSGSVTFGLNVEIINGQQQLLINTLATDGFNPSVADFLPGFPDTALPIFPLNDDDTFSITHPTEGTVLSIGVPIAASVGDDDNGGGNNNDFIINLGLVGAWFDQATAGQGYLIDILVDQAFIFIAWFTYTPDGELVWFTARGVYQDNRAELDVIQSSNGFFNQSTEVVQTVVGSLVIEFTDCLNGTISFNIPGFNATDTVPITRIAGDQICQAIVDGTVVLP